MAVIDRLPPLRPEPDAAAADMSTTGAPTPRLLVRTSGVTAGGGGGGGGGAAALTLRVGRGGRSLVWGDGGTPGGEVPLILVGSAPKAWLTAHDQLIRRLARLSHVEVREQTGDAAKGAAQFVIGEATGYLPIAGLIDVAKEKARLEKEVAKLEADIAKTDAKLSNADFRAKAKPEVVEEQTERRDGWVAARDKLRDALARLG